MGLQEKAGSAGLFATPWENRKLTSLLRPTWPVQWHEWRRARESSSHDADVRAVLLENLEGMRKSLLWLKRSYTKCARIGVKDRYTEDEFDDFENLVSRYARMIDVILNKVFRSIDADRAGG